MEEELKNIKKEFKNLFGVELSRFWNVMLLSVGMKSFDIVLFNNYMESKGYDINKDGSLSDYLKNKYGDKADNLIKNLINKIL